MSLEDMVLVSDRDSSVTLGIRRFDLLEYVQPD